MDTTIEECLTETERYSDEVLNANWLPQIALMCGITLEKTPARQASRAASEDPDNFLRRLYLAQE